MAASKSATGKTIQSAQANRPRRSSRRGLDPAALDAALEEAKQKSVDEQVKPSAPGKDAPAKGKAVKPANKDTSKSAPVNKASSKTPSPVVQPEQPVVVPPVAQNTASAVPAAKRRPGRQPKWELADGDHMEQVTLRLPASVMNQLKLEATQRTQANLTEGLTASDATVNHQDVIMMLIKDHIGNLQAEG